MRGACLRWMVVGIHARTLLAEFVLLGRDGWPVVSQCGSSPTRERGCSRGRANSTPMLADEADEVMVARVDDTRNGNTAKIRDFVIARVNDVDATWSRTTTRGHA